MAPQDIANLRLINQQIAFHPSKNPEQVVTALGAIQAQDYNGALWAIGLRLTNSKKTDIEKSIRDRKIIRTWPMRGTLHFIPAIDAKWMLKLMASRILANASSRERNLGLNDKVFENGRKTVVKILEKNKCMTNNEIIQALEKSNISTEGYRGRHILWHLAQEGTVCFGPHDEKQPTFVLMDEWVPKQRNIEHGDALTEIAKRFFASHGPATLQDFIRWTGLKSSDARKGLENVRKFTKSETINKVEYIMSKDSKKIKIMQKAYLLPGFDEYMLGYKNREDMLHPLHSNKIVPGGNGMFLPTIVIDGRVVGIWKKEVKKNGIIINLQPFNKLTKEQIEYIAIAKEQYSRFLGIPLID